MATYEITVFGTHVTLNGQPVDVPMGGNPYTVAVEAAKKQAEQDVPPGEVVNVMAKTEQGMFPMAIVDGVAMSVGDPIPNPQPAPTTTPEPPRPQEGLSADAPVPVPESAPSAVDDAQPEPASASHSTLSSSWEPVQSEENSASNTSSSVDAHITSAPAESEPSDAARSESSPAGPTASERAAEQPTPEAPQPNITESLRAAWAGSPSHPTDRPAPTQPQRPAQPEANKGPMFPWMSGSRGQSTGSHEATSTPEPTAATSQTPRVSREEAAGVREQPRGHQLDQAERTEPAGMSAPQQTDPRPAAEPVNPFAHTFIERHRAEQAPQPKPVGGFAGVLAQFGIGGPSQAQQAEEADKIAVSQVWTRPKGIAVANGKGGSGKTPTALYLAAMFARLGGGMVLVDDNNTFRGAAGWQTENAAHGATKEDLLRALPSFTGSERAADMARFTHHQTIDRYDVLQSRPQKLARDQALDDAEFDAIQELLRRFYRVVVFDSGNDESAPNWLRMIHHSDALVVPTATTPKHCESAKLLLEALTAQGGHSAELARNAVIVVSHASTNDPAPEQIAPRFAGMAREVLTIPHDPAIAREWLRWDDLAPKTQRAWLAVGAAVARGMQD